MKIDVVYTWVNGADENWRRKKLEYSQQENRQLSKYAVSDARYMDNDELKYSLRSVFKYAPWINNIYIISDNQVPVWLDKNCLKVKVIDHKEIFKNDDFLPTFNSMAIEANLHHIPNLSEYFLYFNDDMFLGDCCLPDYFFLKDGTPRIFVSDIIKIPRKRHLNAEMMRNKIKTEHLHSVVNSRKLLKDRYGKTIYTGLRHGIKACKKSDFYYLEDIFNEQLLNTMSHKFRHNSDVLMQYLVSMYLLLERTGKKTYVPSLSLKFQWLNYLIKKLMEISFCYVHLSSRHLEKIFFVLERNRPTMFCLNQFYDTPTINVAKVRPFLEKYYPQCSPAEKGNSGVFITS